MAKAKEKNKNDYKVIISELGLNPFQVIKVAFALMCVIPLLVVLYIIMGTHFLYDLFLGNNGTAMTIAIFIAFMGLLYAYNLVKTLIEKLLRCAEERRLAENEKSELLVAVGNDLKAPLTALKLGMHSLADGAGAILDSARAGIVKNCINAVEAISGFVEKIMNISKTGFIRMNVRRELIDFRDIVTTEMKGLVELAKKNSLDLQCTFATNNANIWGDAKKLSKAVMSLLYNIIKNTPRGGSVNLAVFSDANTIQFRVSASGQGILPGEADAIFEKSDKLGKYADGGETSIEFPIVKDVIDLHNGHITINNEPDKNTEFRIILPRDLRARPEMRFEI